MITIDGSQGEGGGQILRTSLALSLVTGQPFRIINIRAGRKKPGLMRQHLTAVQAAATIGNAQVDGDSIGSLQLTFIPHSINTGKFTFSTGSAGSCTLVFQTILPALMLAEHQSEITLEGGTHNPFAPPYDFFEQTFLPLVSRMGVNVKVNLEQYGFYPAGGGRFTASITPLQKLNGFDLTQRGEINSFEVRALVANLGESIGHRECRTIGEILGWPKSNLKIVKVKNATGPGNAVVIEIAATHITEIFTAFGERGVPSETVATHVAREAHEYLSSGVPVDSHLADQLMIPFALAKSGSYMTTSLTRHSTTNIEVIRLFLDTAIKVESIENNKVVIGFF
jgi:RNA 3'-terminal phosphate cyclase (ATP)